MKKLFVPFFLFAMLPTTMVLAQSPQNPPARPTTVVAQPAATSTAQPSRNAEAAARPKVTAPGRPAFAPSAASQGRLPQAPVENKKAATTR